MQPPETYLEKDGGAMQGDVTRFQDLLPLAPDRRLTMHRDANPVFDYRFSDSELRSNTTNSGILSEVQRVRCAGGSFPFESIELGGPAAGCAECANELCARPPCPTIKLTSQCTDQCVVIACNDASHSEARCQRSDDQVACTVTDTCVGCDEFEELLHCCTDYHSYLSDPHSLCGESAHIPSPWDFDAFACGCGEQSPEAPEESQVMGSQFSSFGNDANPLKNAEYTADFPLSMTAAVTPTFPTRDHVTAPQSHLINIHRINNAPDAMTSDHSQPSSLSCMWGDCHKTFSSRSELVGHVNDQHLRLQTSPPELSMVDLPQAQTLETQNQNQLNLHDNNTNLSCLWADCNLFPSVDSLPGPSSGNQVDAALDFLATHLLQDHLGFQTHENLLDYSDASDHLPKLQECDVQSGKQSPSITPPPMPSESVQDESLHECMGTHVCRWKSCGQTFSSCDQLTDHIVVFHIGTRKAHYECFWADCNRNGERGFPSKQKISRHLQTHTGHRPFQCKLCQQNFSEAATLQQHMRRHTQEKPHICDYPGCGKAFAITGALTIHKRMHNGNKPFKCSYCDRAFAESSNLSKHLRTHTGERPYLCAEKGCGKSFSRPDQLTRHMGIHRRKIESNKNIETGQYYRDNEQSLS